MPDGSTCDRGAIISIGMYSSAQGTQTPTDGYTIRGSEGVIHVPPSGSRTITMARGGEQEEVQIDADLAGERAFVRLRRLFRKASEHDGEVPVTGPDALKDAEWGLVAYVLSRDRRWVDLPLSSEYDDFMGPVLERMIPAMRQT